MKKTLIALMALAGAVTAAETLKITSGSSVTLDTSKTYRLDFEFNKTAATTFTVTTTGNQTITGTDGYNITGDGVTHGAAAADITFILGGKLTADGTYKNFGEKFANGVTLNMNMGLTGSFYSAGPITLKGLDSELNISTETNLNLCNIGISTRDLITIGGGGSIWYSVNNGATNLSLRDITLEQRGYSYAGVLYLTANNTYVNLAGQSVSLGDNQYAMLFQRTDNDYTDVPEKVSLLINKTVPEPTTATLSLLALAGLASRRRRK